MLGFLRVERLAQLPSVRGATTRNGVCVRREAIKGRPAGRQNGKQAKPGQFTVCEIDPALPLKLAAAAYVAVMVSVPAGKVVTANLALPAARAAVPSVVDPSVNVTVPVGVA